MSAALCTCSMPHPGLHGGKPSIKTCSDFIHARVSGLSCAEKHRHAGAVRATTRSHGCSSATWEPTQAHLEQRAPACAASHGMAVQVARNKTAGAAAAPSRPFYSDVAYSDGKLICRLARTAAPLNSASEHRSFGAARAVSGCSRARRLLAMQQAAGPMGAGPVVGQAHGMEAAAAAAGLLRCICGSMAGRGMMVQCEVRLQFGGISD